MTTLARGNRRRATAAAICRWHGGRKAALSLRFDDSHPTQIENALPLLNEYGCIGTFMVNPGDTGYLRYRDVWEGALPAAGHELGVHGFHHRGAETDRDAERQFGQAAEAIRRVDPERFRLLTVVRGGATQWMQRKPYDYFVVKYRLVDPPRDGEMSCREDGPWTPAEFANRLEHAIADGDWMRAHFHCVGKGWLTIAVQSFRAVLETVRKHREDVWQAGINSIVQYRYERERSRVWTHAGKDDTLVLDFACEVDTQLYRQPLTLEVALPAGCPTASVRDSSGRDVPVRTHGGMDGTVLRFDLPPVDATFEIRAKGLGAAYRETHGPDFPATGRHPHLFFRRQDLPLARARMAQPGTKERWRELRAKADRILAEPFASSPVALRTGDQVKGNAKRLRTLAAVYALVGDPACAERATSEIEAILTAESWAGAKHMAIGFVPDLVVAEIACNLALGYDWLYDAMTETQRSRVREAIVRRGLEPIVEATRTGVWWTHWARCNWGAVIFGQAGVAALSLLDEDSRAAEWVRLFRNRLWHWLQAIGRDGGWGESVSYACYAWSNGIMFMDALNRATNGQCNLFDAPGMRRLPEWFAHLLTPDQTAFVPFSNCGRGARFPGQFLSRLGLEFDDGHARWMAQRMASDTVFGRLWRDPPCATTSPSDLPTAKVFRDIDWAVLRSRWDDPDATLFALKGGQKDWDHAHHDTNHFVLFAYGEPLIVDLLYPRDPWGCKTEAHNTIMVNGRDQAGHVHVAGGRDDPMHRGVISDLLDVPWYSRLVGDASLAYEPDEVNSFVREVMYLRNTEGRDKREYFVVFDDVDAAAPSRYDWRLHTYGRITQRGRRITITQGQAAVDVTLVSPADSACELSEKRLEDIQCPPAIDGADTVRGIKLTPTQPPESPRGSFVAVLSPRQAAAPSDDMQIVPVTGDSLRGAEIVFGETRDLALFALDAPRIVALGVEAKGRTCFVRRTGGNVTHAALHGGNRLAVDGVTLFETRASGAVALSFFEDGVSGTLSLYNAASARVYSARRPSSVCIDGQRREFKHDPHAAWVEIPLDGSMVERPTEVLVRYTPG